jgi:hypothetical protein
MSETARMWMEISFNVAYLIVVWTLVIIMVRRYSEVTVTGKNTAKWVLIAFGLLALGDTGHVGFRVLAYALGNLEMTVNLFGGSVSLISIGTFATSVTVTLFYVMMVFVWRERFNKRIGWFEWILFAAAAVRIVMLLLPQNEWALIDPPYPFNIYRNIPLLVQGLGVTWLILRDAVKDHDRSFIWIGEMILVSYACYTPVLFLAREYPLIALLMMPKTLAYLAVAFIAYFDLYPKKIKA